MMQASPSISDVEIFPNRLLSAKTAEKLLNAIEELEDVQEIVVHGPSLGRERREIISLHGKEVELRVAVGRIIMRTNNPNSLVEKVREICDELLPFGYSIRVGKFLKDRPTIHDSIMQYLLVAPEREEDLK
ncbi:MAG: methyl-coenzyme M reductase operon protein D [Thermoproteota archaeon]|jgi:methyl-coenzyme M reductase subunit D|uniref:Methyl-coenzyme M reductase operon protein D n=1 Tax=Candidatus Methanodesulfokora washburnensis TaxID=2478471 RepID=A0A3R9QC08_9CREN|nr:methyl-coenzyme M reductase operon protein D [Candidatus Methanodesulfokores washburnensis]RSN72834.1 methyl-coenzyme M reductase operon protein D [Candidatus Methanodesulfokores washburnensis]RZN63749.1 MAG: methyl-coenzyme M reductase operon protein D [Candidatus Methanodesulfokores washburnensis]TDA40883.1 MAG: methyl-coenzyme M reductase operon protein D [Candidatus Korarchaeota archaeon]